jgi:hypothetical protein
MWEDFFEKDALSEPFEYYNSAGGFEPFEAQTAWDYYVDLEQALRDIPDYPAVYRRVL